MRFILSLWLPVAALAGAQAQKAELQPSPLQLECLGVALKKENTHIWGASPIMGPEGRIHLFVAQWERPVRGRFGGSAYRTSGSFAFDVNDWNGAGGNAAMHFYTQEFNSTGVRLFSRWN